jgi:hypothetical protein
MKPSKFYLIVQFSTQTIHNHLRCHTIADVLLKFASFVSPQMPLRTKKLNSSLSQVWTETQNYSMKLCLNVTLSPTRADEPHNWSPWSTNPPPKHDQTSAFVKNFTIKKVPFWNFWVSFFLWMKHRCVCVFEGFFALQRRMNEKVSRWMGDLCSFDSDEVGFSRKFKSNSLEMRAARWRKVAGD